MSDQASTESENGQEVVEESLQNPPEGETTETSDGTGSGDPEISAVPGARRFKNPLLAEKSDEEIENLFQMQQAAIASQNRELNERHARMTAEEQERAPAPKVDPADYGESFLAPHFAKMEERLRSALEETVRPLREATTMSAGQTIRQRLTQELPHFGVLEPHIDQVIRQYGTDPTKVNEKQLKAFYYMVLGMANSQGANLGTSTTAETTKEDQPVTIPQRRPSSAPLAKPAAPKHRQLTEEERRLAKEYKMTDAEYLTEMDLPLDEVVQPGFSKEGW